MTPPVAVVIPAFGRHELTHAVIAQLTTEAERCSVIVVDNGGDFEARNGEQVLRPGKNLGWLRGTNTGLRHALADDHFTGFCLLNNDVTLAEDFVTGLMAAADATGAGIVAPCYDDHYRVQTEYYTGSASSFAPSAVEADADVVDGTCMLMPRHVLETVGLMDERRFGRYGWGGADDWCLRVRRAGHRVVVTRRAYLQHHTGATASEVHSEYRLRATAEMYVGMRRKYGSHWMRLFPSGSFDHHGDGLREYWEQQKRVWADTSARLRTRRGW